ncbi:MAG: GNAT family N-acetyltransferase [Clostridiales bacterium]|nr:GNAT family N-acetyltransferase [Clostridiales bacterium]
MIQLKPVTRENLENVLALRVSTEQQRYVSPTAHSLAQAYVYRETAFPFAVYADETLVGFIMFGYYEARRQYTLWKFLIDQRYQGRGYGRAALMKGIAYMKETFAIKELYTGVSLGNAAAKQLYRSVGFAETGLVEDGMEEMKYTC